MQNTVNQDADATEKANKKMSKLLDEQSSLEKKQRNTQQDLDDVKKDIDAQQKEVLKQQQTLDALTAKSRLYQVNSERGNFKIPLFTIDYSQLIILTTYFFTISLNFAIFLFRFDLFSFAIFVGFVATRFFSFLRACSISEFIFLIVSCLFSNCE